MENTINKKLSQNILDKISIEFLRNQVLKNAYGNDDTIIAKLDARVLLVWYVFFAIVPWFADNLIFLAGCFCLVVVTTILAKVAGLVLFLFGIGVFSQTGYMFVVSLFFGGNVETVVSISYAYRILPMLMEEFQNILLSYRLRGNAPDNSTFLGKIKYMCYQIRVIMRAFYPLMLNTAKRSRTTVEALELKGYRYAAVNREVKKLKLAQMKIGYDELLVLVVSVLWVAVTILLCSC